MAHPESWNPERDGVLTEQGLRRKLEDLGYHVSRYVYQPGTKFPAHSHGADKIDAVISGRFKITLEGEPVILEAGDWIQVPRGAQHSAEVVGRDPVVSLDAVRR